MATESCFHPKKWFIHFIYSHALLHISNFSQWQLTHETMRGLPGKRLNEWQWVQWGDWPNLTTVAMTRLCAHTVSPLQTQTCKYEWLIIPSEDTGSAHSFQLAACEMHTIPLYTHTHTHSQRSPTSIQAFETWNELWLKPAAMERRCDEVKCLCFTNYLILNDNMFLYVLNVA